MDDSLKNDVVAYHFLKTYLFAVPHFSNMSHILTIKQRNILIGYYWLRLAFNLTGF